LSSASSVLVSAATLGVLALGNLVPAFARDYAALLVIRLIPQLAPASVALNTSVLCVGKAIGSATGGLLFGRELLHCIGLVAVAFVVLLGALVLQTQPTGTRPMAAD